MYFQVTSFQLENFTKTKIPPLLHNTIISTTMFQQSQLTRTTHYEFSHPFTFERDFNEENAIKWMEENWHMSFWLSALYVIVIFGGQYYMQRRTKYDLRPALALWSGILALFSIVAAIRMVSESIYVVYKYGWDYSVCYPSIYYGDTAIWAFLFAVSKAYELGDTVFIILRKQPLIFLHWYHHVTVMIYSWYTYAYFYAPGRWFAAINCVVHSLMYTYYCCRALRFRMPRWVNICITTSQILQMLFGIYVNISAYWVLKRGDNCHITYDNIKYSLLMYLSYFILFAHFFYNAYLKPKQPQYETDMKNKQTAHTNGHVTDDLEGKQTNGLFQSSKSKRS